MPDCCTYFKVAGKEYFVDTQRLIDEEGRLVLADTCVVFNVNLKTCNLPQQVGDMTQFVHHYEGLGAHQIASILGAAVAHPVSA